MTRANLDSGGDLDSSSPGGKGIGVDSAGVDSQAWSHLHKLYDLGLICGSGSFSVVRKVTRISTGEVLAAKFVTRKEAEKELSILSKLPTCDKILQYTDALVDEDLCGINACLIGEYMYGSDLHSALMDRGSFAEEDARLIMRQLLVALDRVHGAGVAHRDVKLENILLPSADDPTEIRLCDFGMADVVTPSDPCLSVCCGTPLYVAPEVLARHCRYDTKVDIWSAGVVLHMLLAGFPPFSSPTMQGLLHHIAAGRVSFSDPAWELVTPKAKEFVRALLTKDPQRRLSAAQALAHPWMQET